MAKHAPFVETSNANKIAGTIVGRKFRKLIKHADKLWEISAELNLLKSWRECVGVSVTRIQHVSFDT